MWIIDAIRGCIAKRSKLENIKKRREIRSRFYIREAGGVFFLVCDGTAFATFENGDTFCKAYEALEYARSCSIAFASVLGHVAPADEDIKFEKSDDHKNFHQVKK